MKRPPPLIETLDTAGLVCDVMTPRPLTDPPPPEPVLDGLGVSVCVLLVYADGRQVRGWHGLLSGWQRSDAAWRYYPVYLDAVQPVGWLPMPAQRGLP